MQYKQISYGAIYGLLAILAVSRTVQGETIFLNRDVMADGRPVAWYGTSTVFVGHYSWPDNRAPLGLYNGTVAERANYPLVAEPDYTNVTCDVKTDTCTIAGPTLFGGLPDTTEVKFVTTGSLPGGLTSWKDNPKQVYYIRESSNKKFKLATTPDGPPVDLDDSVEGGGTHGLSFAGYSHVITLLAAATAQQYTVDPASDVLTTEKPHGLSNHARVFVQSTEVLPSPLVAFEASGYWGYCAEVIDERQLKLRKPKIETSCGADNPGSPVDITDEGTGILYVYTRRVPVVNISSISGYPPGTVLTWRRTTWAMGSLQYSVQRNGGYGSTENNTATFFAKVPAVTPPGEYLIRVATNENRANDRNAGVFEYTLYAVGIPKANKSGPSTYPSIPGLSSSVIPGRPHRYWENMMVSEKNGGGASQGGFGTGVQWNRCANRQDPEHPWGFLPPSNVTPHVLSYSQAANGQVWFYNDETFFEIAKYTGDPTWANCGIDVARVMRDKFQKSGPTSMYGYFYFPWTLVAAYRLTGDVSYKEEVISIADGGTNYRGDVRDMYMREHAFAFEARLARRAVTGEEDYNLQYFADVAIAMLYINAARSPERTFNEPFMLGLLMRPLIRWYMLSHDERVPAVIKLTLDKLWDEWYDKSTHRLLYNPEPFGMRCRNSCNKPTSTALNNLVSPAFAWYWRLTGDDTYRERGDDLFAYVWADGEPYFAKEWSQGFYWSWDFVRWRKGEQPAY